MRELQKSNDRKLLGVAAGFAEYFGLDRTLVRAGWILASILMPPMVLAYLILGIFLPSAPPAPYGQPWGQGSEQPPGQAYGGATGYGPQGGYQAPPANRKRLTKSRDRWLSGVAGGVAEYLDLDPVLARMIFLASLFLGGTGLVVYIILAILMPRPDWSEYQHR